MTAVPLTVVRPTRGWASLNLVELWAYRSLMLFLVWRNLKIHYAQTALGIAWVVAQPVLATVIFSVFLGRLAGFPSDGAPYAVFALAGFVPWMYFSGALTGASTSLVTDHNLLTKVYFPRLVMPVAAVLAGLVDLAICSVVSVVVIGIYGLSLSPVALILAPLGVLIIVATALGLGSGLGALNLRYRDVRHAVPFLLQLWMFASPIVYPASLVPERFAWLYGLNPIVGAVALFRGALIGTPIPWSTVIAGALVAAVFLAAGIAYFRRTERRFADIA